MEETEEKKPFVKKNFIKGVYVKQVYLQDGLFYYNISYDVDKYLPELARLRAGRKQRGHCPDIVRAVYVPIPPKRLGKNGKDFFGNTHDVYENTHGEENDPYTYAKDKVKKLKNPTKNWVQGLEVTIFPSKYNNIILNTMTNVKIFTKELARLQKLKKAREGNPKYVDIIYKQKPYEDLKNPFMIYENDYNPRTKYNPDGTKKDKPKSGSNNKVKKSAD